jgi:preprotein translocase subunit SecG
VFFVTSLLLAYVASSAPKTTGSVMQDTVESTPASGAVEKAGDAGNTGSKAKDIPN